MSKPWLLPEGQLVWVDGRAIDIYSNIISLREQVKLLEEEKDRAVILARHAESVWSNAYPHRLKEAEGLFYEVSRPTMHGLRDAIARFKEAIDIKLPPCPFCEHIRTGKEGG